MSIDLYVLTPLAREALCPARLGLGVEPFVWPDADRFEGFEYEGATLSFSVFVDDEPEGIGQMFRDFAPPGMTTYLSLYLRDYRDDFERQLGTALEGYGTDDASLYEMEGEAFSMTDDPTARARARSVVRGAFWADRFGPTTPEGQQMIAHAVAGVAGAIDVLHFWNGKGRDGCPPTRFDMDAVRARLLDEADRHERISSELLEMFVQGRKNLVLDQPTQDRLARVIDASAMQRFSARGEAERVVAEEQRALLDEAKRNGDFF